MVLQSRSVARMDLKKSTSRFLLLGNMGYVGPVVVEHLRRSYPEAYIAGVDSGWFAGCLSDPCLFPERHLDAQFFGDVRHIPESMFSGFDAVVALAAVSNDPMGNRFELATADINARAVVHAAIAARNQGVKSFVFASSCSVYGEGGSHPRSESSAVNPLTAYAKSKLDAETALQGLATANFKITALRFATACGWSPRLRLDLVLNDFVASAYVDKRINILSDGSPWRPVIHVKDMARAIDWACSHRSGVSEPFVVLNAGSNNLNFSVFQLAQAVAKEIEGAEVVVNRSAEPDKRSYRVDFSLFSELAPSHQPTMTVPETVVELVNGLRVSGFTDKNFRSSHLVRLNVLRAAVESGSIDDRLIRV